jgi:hypothetical protein
MATLTPVWTDNVSVVAAQVLARGSTVRGTIDLRGKFSATLFGKVGRTGTSALTNGVVLLARRVINNDSPRAGGVHPSPDRQLYSVVEGASATTVSGDSAAGQAELQVDSVTGFAADDLICIRDADGGMTRLEWHRVSKVETGILKLDRPLQFSHAAAQADSVHNKSDAFFPIHLPGGSLWEVIFDYGDDSAGESVVVQALAQTNDSEVSS